jgi:hypothetical protein
MPSLNRRRFRSTLIRELRSAWETLRRAHPTERFYAFGVYTTAVVDYLAVTASTEEALAVATQRYVERYGGDPALRSAALRWSPVDSPLHEEGESLLAASDDLRQQGPDPYDESPEADAAIALVFEVAVEALRELDRQGVFGSGAERARVVLGIWQGDQSDEERVDFVRKLNPGPVVARFAREVEAGARASRALGSQ